MVAVTPGFSTHAFCSTLTVIIHVRKQCSILQTLYQLQVCTNGLFSFGTPQPICCPSLFTSTSPIQPVIAPFWADINVNSGGFILYEIHTNSTSSALLTQVNEFIQTQHQNNFAGTWMLVAEWNNVPQFGSTRPVSYIIVYLTSFGRAMYT